MRFKNSVYVHIDTATTTRGRGWVNILEIKESVPVPDAMSDDARTLEFYGAFLIAEQFWAIREGLAEMPDWWKPSQSPASRGESNG